MKKKIVYISGAEVFDVNDVRAAFEEVRNTLKLDADTILFGVPVDAAESVDKSVVATESAENAVDTDEIPAQEVELDNTDCEENIEDEEVVENDGAEPEVGETENEAEMDAPVVPILSVLAAKEETVIEPEPVVETQAETDESVVDEPIELDDAEQDMADMINDEMPEDSQEKTLEELLETMAPLHEEPVKPKKDEPVAPVDIEQVDEIDATLENLASEFAENQDKVGGTKKSAERGKIGKLKNILPFKKTKRDDPGLMGDLFGWAGIAANDDDFTIPGFFKQKM